MSISVIKFALYKYGEKNDQKTLNSEEKDQIVGNDYERIF